MDHSIVEIFNNQISNRLLEPVRLKLPHDVEKCTVYWEGVVLPNDWIEVPGLAGCLGIICIASYPTKQHVKKKPDGSALGSNRSSTHKEIIDQVSRKTQRYSQILEEVKQKKIVSPALKRASSSLIEGQDSYQAYAIHAMGLGHFVAKEKLQKIFDKHPNKDSLKIYFYCTTRFGQLEWLIKERGRTNVISRFTDGSCLYDENKDMTLAILQATPKLSGDNAKYAENTRFVQLTGSNDKYTPPRSYNSNLRVHILTKEVDGVQLTMENYQDIEKLKENHYHHLHKVSRANWHNTNNCEICNIRVGSAMSAFLSFGEEKKWHAIIVGRVDEAYVRIAAKRIVG